MYKLNYNCIKIILFWNICVLLKAYMYHVKYLLIVINCLINLLIINAKIKYWLCRLHVFCPSACIENDNLLQECFKKFVLISRSQTLRPLQLLYLLKTKNIEILTFKYSSRDSSNHRNTNSNEHNVLVFCCRCLC